MPLLHMTAQSHAISWVSMVNICILNQGFTGGKEVWLLWHGELRAAYLRFQKSKSLLQEGENSLFSLPLRNHIRSIELPQGRLGAEVRSISMRLAAYQPGWSILWLYTQTTHISLCHVSLSGDPSVACKGEGGKEVSLRSVIKQASL